MVLFCWFGGRGDDVAPTTVIKTFNNTCERCLAMSTNQPVICLCWALHMIIDIRWICYSDSMLYLLQELVELEELKRQQEEFRLQHEEQERQRLEQERIEEEERERRRVCLLLLWLCWHSSC